MAQFSLAISLVFRPKHLVAIGSFHQFRLSHKSWPNHHGLVNFFPVAQRNRSAEPKMEKKGMQKIYENLSWLAWNLKSNYYSKLITVFDSTTMSFSKPGLLPTPQDPQLVKSPWWLNPHWATLPWMIIPFNWRITKNFLKKHAKIWDHRRNWGLDSRQNL